MKRFSKVLLMTAPYHCGVVESAGTWMPLGLAMLAGALRNAGFDPEIFDAMSRFDDFESVRRELRRRRPDVVAITSITATYPAALECLRIAKQELPRCRTVMGGVHSHFMYAEVLEKGGGAVDAVVRGEGEQALPELLRAWEAGADLKTVPGLAFLEGAGVLATPGRPFIQDLEALAPAWDLLEWPLYTYFPLEGSRLAVVSTSRGCPHQCSFCSQQKFWKRSWRGRRPECVVAELEQLRRLHGVDVALFADEYPTPDAERFRAILALARERLPGMRFLMETRVGDIVRDKAWLEEYRRAGLIHVYVGVEAVDQGRLDGFRKDSTVDQNREAIRLINGHGMVSETSFVLGLPEESEASVESTLAQAQEYGADFAHFLLVAPWPYADLYPTMRPYIETLDYSQYNLVSPVARTLHMDRPALMRAVVGCYRRYYMGRMKPWMDMPAGFKKDYLFKSMQHVLRSSFLKEHLGGMGEVPAEVAKYFSKGKGCPVSALGRIKGRLAQWAGV